MTDADRQLSREITPLSTYLNRRQFVRAGLLAGSVAATGFIYRRLNHTGHDEVKTAAIAGLSTATTAPSSSGFHVDEPMTPLKSITNYNNFYEFSTDKEDVSRVAKDFISRPWKVEVGGMCAKPKTFDIDDLIKLAAPEERVYRMRCVEAWSMVIPWDGFSLSVLLNAVEPTSSAKYVAFETLNDPKRFPNQTPDVLPWPYVEGLRMDEAMHPLTMLASGIYGHELPAADGAPIRLVIPWKYGFKGIKSIVKITLTDKEPPSTWNKLNAPEYGFYANVNPRHDHPRWSQGSERRIGADGIKVIPTLMFNGYSEQVASLYSGMDLDKFY